MKLLVLSIDIGTSSCKIGLYDSGGKALTKLSKSYPIHIPKPNLAEQDPEDWWKAVCSLIRELIYKRHYDPQNVKAICISSQCPVIFPIDKEGKPLYRALLWMDRRAIDEVKIIEEKIGVKFDSSFPIPKILWFKRHLPEVYAKTFKFLQPLDYIIFKLTGKIVTDYFTASTAGFNLETKRYAEDALASLNIDSSLLPEPLKPGEIVGSLSDEASKILGLNKDTLVVMGSIDAYLAVLGCGCIKPGVACEIAGTSTCIMVAHDRKIVDPKGRVFCSKHFVDGLWIVSAIMATTGACVEWFRKNVLEGVLEISEMFKGVEEVEAGSLGLIFLPYLSGERSPIWDPRARGILFGLTLKHNRKHILRAILEGCAYAIRHNVDVLRELGVNISELRVCGGGAKNELWNQIKADVLGINVYKMYELDASLLGASILAFTALEQYNSLIEACNKMVKADKCYVPNVKNHEIYNRLYKIYCEIYPRIKDLFELLKEEE